MKLKDVAYIFYPIFIVLALIFLLLLACPEEKSLMAGTIRRATITMDKPLVVRLAQGRTTAISFAVRPEKVVPGNPQALEINFLAHDLALRPLGPNPGNLIVYTKSSRYVILLTLGSESSYDDIVNVQSGFSGNRVVRLAEDSILIQQFKLKRGSKELSINAEVKESGKSGTFQDLPLHVKCDGCILRDQLDYTDFSCRMPVVKLNCHSGLERMTLTRVNP